MNRVSLPLGRTPRSGAGVGGRDLRSPQTNKVLASGGACEPCRAPARRPPPRSGLRPELALPARGRGARGAVPHRLWQRGCRRPRLVKAAPEGRAGFAGRRALTRRGPSRREWLAWAMADPAPPVEQHKEGLRLGVGDQGSGSRLARDRRQPYRRDEGSGCSGRLPVQGFLLVSPEHVDGDAFEVEIVDYHKG